jgi:hypothetical protein
VAWAEATGYGTVYSRTVIRQNPSRSFRHLLPFVVALVDLDEGPRMMTNIVDCAAADVNIGQRVSITFASELDGVALPFFRPTEEPSP